MSKGWTLIRSDAPARTYTEESRYLLDRMIAGLLDCGSDFSVVPVARTNTQNMRKTT